MDFAVVGKIILLTCVGLFTLIAAVSDLRTRRIPNKLTLPMFVVGLLYRPIFHGGLEGLGDAGLAFLVGFTPLFVLWLIGGGGGGDVKMMGALSVWLGFALTFRVLIVSTVFVILGTAGVMIWSVMTHGSKSTKRKFLATGKDEQGKKPEPETLAQKQGRRVMAYAAPVALATWTVLLWQIDKL